MLAQLMPITDILPRMPKIAERTTGEVMGEAAERMAQRNEITREAQDELAVRSHHRAARAIASGPLRRRGRAGANAGGATGSTPTASCAATPASRSSRSCGRCSPRTARSPPATASPLTDGAAAVLLMSEEKAQALGYTPLAAFRELVATSASIPADQLLMGPALAMPKALDRAGMTLARHRPRRHARGVRGAGAERAQDARQRGVRRERLGRDDAVGEIDPTPQRPRRLDRDRPPVRRDRRAHGHDDGQRARDERQRDRAARHLRRGRTGRGAVIERGRRHRRRRSPGSPCAFATSAP